MGCYKTEFRQHKHWKKNYKNRENGSLSAISKTLVSVLPRNKFWLYYFFYFVFCWRCCGERGWGVEWIILTIVAAFIKSMAELLFISLSVSICRLQTTRMFGWGFSGHLNHSAPKPQKGISIVCLWHSCCLLRCSWNHECATTLFLSGPG